MLHQIGFENIAINVRRRVIPVRLGQVESDDLL